MEVNIKAKDVEISQFKRKSCDVQQSAECSIRLYLRPRVVETMSMWLESQPGRGEGIGVKRR
jgi:hypothetical protein